MDVVIIPTLNERKNIQALIPRIFSSTPDIHVLVVDDNSPDGTQEAVHELKLNHPNLHLYPHNQKSGFGKAYIDGMRHALETYPNLRAIIMMDADSSHDPEALPRIREHLNDYDVVIGSRYVRGGSVVGWEWYRRLLSAAGNFYLRCFRKVPANDITGGYNGIRADKLRRINLNSITARGYGFQFVLKYLLATQGARFKETPITFRNRLEGESKISRHIVTEALILPWKLPKP